MTVHSRSGRVEVQQVEADNMLGAAEPAGTEKKKRKLAASTDPRSSTAKPKKAGRGVAVTTESVGYSLSLKQQRELDVSKAVLLTAQQVVGHLRSEHIFTVTTKTFDSTYNKV